MMTVKRFKWILLFLSVAVLGLSLISLSLGSSHLSLISIVKAFLGMTDHKTQFIILSIRLPRILATLVAGASLALSGMLLQTLTQNPLADSGILGINAGAGIVVATTISLMTVTNPTILALLPFLAMAGAFITVFTVFLISRKKNHDISPVRLIITGVGVSTMLSGIMISIVGNIDRFKVEYVVNWLSGRVSGDDWQTLLIVSPLLIGLWLLTYSRSRSLNIMALNEQTATALGLKLQKERLITLLLATALAALSVVLVGNITFIGLLAGHITQKYVGRNHFFALPAGLLVGMLILLIADTLGRVFLVGTNIPTGIVVSIIGAPYFLYLMKQTDT